MTALCGYCGSATPHMDGCPKQASAIARAVREALDARDEAMTRRAHDLAATAASTKQIRLDSGQAQLLFGRNDNRGVVILVNDDASKVFVATDRNVFNDTTKQVPFNGKSAMILTTPGELWGLGSTVAAQSVYVLELPPGRQSAEFAQIIGSMLGSSGTPQIVRVEDGAGTSLATVATTNADALGTGNPGLLELGLMYGFNGATWDRLRTAAGINVAALSGLGALLTLTPGEWGLSADPGANVVATATRAGVAGVRQVARSITCTLVAGAVAPAAQSVLFVLRDGLSGVGAILWQGRISMEAVAGKSPSPLIIGGLNLVGSPGNAMTIEATVAAGANTFETVALTGTTV